MDYENDRNTSTDLRSTSTDLRGNYGGTRHSSTSASRWETKTARHSSTSPSRMETKTRDQHHSFSSLGPTRYESTFVRSSSLPKIFSMSVEQMTAGIARNTFNHFKENEDEWKECLHEIIQPWEMGWDPTTGWSTRKECTCDDCKKNLSREWWNNELISFQDIIAEDNTRTSLLRNTGIRVDVLIAFAIDHDCWEWPTWRVVRDIIKPATRATRCRYGDLPGMKENNYFADATVFISHTWGAPFGNLVAAASQGSRYNRYVWIDIFAVRQWPGNVADLDFRDVIEESTAMVVSVSPVKGLAKRFSSSSELLISLVVMVMISVGLLYVSIFSSPTDETDQKVKDMGIVATCAWCCIFVWWCWVIFRKGGRYWQRKESLGEAAKKSIFFYRLWCVVEVASAVENKIPIVIKGGAAIKNEEGVYEYYRNAVGDIFYNMEDMVDIESSDCAVPEDKIREMNTIREKFGVNCNTIINGMVSSVITGARITGQYWYQDNNSSIEVDSASCGEFELLDNLYAGLEPTENQIELATKVLKAACVGGRWRVVNFLKEHWKENKHGFCKLVDSSMALSLAAKYGYINVVKVLLEIRGIDVNAGEALSLAAKYGYIDVVRVLLDTRGIDVNAGHTLYRACKNNKLQVVDMLLFELVDLNHNEGKNNGNDDEVNSLCNNSLIDPNQQKPINSLNCCIGTQIVISLCGANFFETPLSVARKKGYKEVVQRLLQHPDINKKCTYNCRRNFKLGFSFCNFVTIVAIVLINFTGTTGSMSQSCVCHTNSTGNSTVCGSGSEGFCNGTCENGPEVFCIKESLICKCKITEAEKNEIVYKGWFLFVVFLFFMAYLYSAIATMKANMKKYDENGEFRKQHSFQGHQRAMWQAVNRQ